VLHAVDGTAVRGLDQVIPVLAITRILTLFVSRILGLGSETLHLIVLTVASELLRLKLISGYPGQCSRQKSLQTFLLADVLDGCRCFCHSGACRPWSWDLPALPFD
jgi:hypothetical protein